MRRDKQNATQKKKEEKHLGAFPPFLQIPILFGLFKCYGRNLQIVAYAGGGLMHGDGHDC